MSKRSISSPSPPLEAKRLQKVNKGLANTIYEPLPQGEFIRVLKLQPGKAEDDIQCSLDTIQIGTSKDAYEAISYVWGDAKHTVDVWCNGLQVPITASLASALRNFRHPSEPRLLWADALCINQKDDQEKGHQVKRMGQVYANAKCVLVWLGCDVNNVAKDTFALICEANTYFKYSLMKAGNKASRMELFEEPYPISIDQDRWSGVVKLFKFSWFQRVWTVQEVAVAAECRMFWGSASVDISDVLEICVWLNRKSDFYATIQGIVGSIKYRFGRDLALYFHYNTHRPASWQQSRAGLAYTAIRYKKHTLCGILGASRNLQATDPRDHVYAFLGCPVAKDGKGRTLVDADYTSSIHVLYIRLAHALMKSPTEGPFALSAVYHRSRESLLNSGCPSWVPAWHVRVDHGVRIMDPKYWYRANGSTKFFTTISPNEEGFLTVGGFIFDKVVWSSNTIQVDRTGLSYTHPNPTACESDELPIDTLLNHVYQRTTGLGFAVRREDIVRTLKLGYPAERSNESISDERQKGKLEAYKKKTCVARSSGVETVELTAREKRRALHFEHSLRGLDGSKLFLTENGRLGMIPHGGLVEVGDVCCIIFGAIVPFLLTPAKEGRHKLVSDCYIHGAMDGAVVQQFAGSDLSDHRIIIE
ncbi:hypothetical protein GT037_005867 [Alternaria burnsii]|uniref:Heterokaryon incompatibility domain-containing protein n=1 Tax=Alternaria burnsii TaxID=1187904 RepID=A0A8H7B4T9_9PLEO|nr:uncharacterized protein GT037_005867 [Alternaria burnsii]KAF7676362.1 hypothetical protein GT037_005867 [Alternaria burnsii]